jgi:hypothetical protein
LGGAFFYWCLFLLVPFGTKRPFLRCFVSPQIARRGAKAFALVMHLHQQSYNRDLWWVSLLLPLCLAAAVFLIIMIFGV